MAQRWAGLAIKLTERVESLQREDARGAKNFFEEIELKIKTYSSDPGSSSEDTIKHYTDLISDK